VNLTERVNRTIKQMLRTHLIDHSHSNWAEFLPFFQMAINSSRQESSKYSPSEAFLGRTMTLPIDNSLDNIPLPGDEKLYNNICFTMQQNLVHASAVQKQYYDRCHDNEEFHIGDQVLLKDVQLSNKSRGITAGLNPLYGPD